MLRPFLLTASLFSTFGLSAAFDLRDGDRVLLLGDTLLEREGTYGLLETRLLQQFPTQHFTVRNLAFAGDTPLGWSRASFDPASRGLERLKEQLGLVKPTVAIIGYGMAASLQELTDRNGDWTQNRDTVRYGAEPMSAARFKRELAQCMDAVTASAGGAPVRFVLLSPLAHEDLRASRPGLPDPAAHNAVLAAYRQAIAELASERSAVHVDLSQLRGNKPLTDNGIHLNASGHAALVGAIAQGLGWPAAKPAPDGLREAVVRKSELFFHRWRPENETYLFGFRKHEQGRNGAEIPQFDPLIALAENNIEALRQGRDLPPVMGSAPAAPAREATPLPQFTLAEGLELSLWAENPFLAKPTQVNWDADGRLWAASSSLYPQIAPGEAASDSIVILEDPGHSGKASKSTVFASGLLIPTAVLPVKGADGKWGCYVGQSTELLYFSDTDGDGKADSKRIVFSGFGTEDTHHLIHTLRMGPDGRVYFSQSIYIHSHLETPHGMVRLNSGGVLAYEPRTERVEVVAKGLVNTWGHVWNKAGQSFLTDGAGGAGINWIVPGAMQVSYEGARRLLPSVSPGSYPKFAGLELVDSPLFAQDWAGSALTCDFRAHKVVRFGIEDLAPSGQSGYLARQAEVPIQTNDSAFRPIDVKVGPDGAVYLADWSNPIINHGEVDFRDPRRDHTRGRIWRLSRKGAAPLAWKPLGNSDNASLEKLLASPNPWEREQASALLHIRGKLNPPPVPGLDALEKLSRDPSPRVRLGAMRDLARTPSARTAGLILAAAVNKPQGDDFYDYAAWLSVNDVGNAWVEALVSGQWKAEGKDAQLEYALNTLPPETSQRVLAGLVDKRGVPAEGSWIEIIGKSGGPKELRRLYDACAGFSEPAFARATQALAEAARLRNARPEGDLSGAAAWLEDASETKRLAGARLAGPWKLSAATGRLQTLASGPDRRLGQAAMESLRALGRADELRALAAHASAPVRLAATLELARLNLAKALPEVFATLRAVSDEAALQTFWTELLQLKEALKAVSEALPSDLPVAAVKTGLRASRALGKRAEALTAKLTAQSGAAAATPAAPGVAELVALAKTKGDPVAGELVYRRAASACVLCHAIGGAGGKLGPDLTSIGASAPLDYIVESVVSPALKVKEGYHAFAFALKDGSESVGIPSRETAQEQFIRTAGGEISLPKSAIVSKKMAEGGASLMPAGLTATMSETEQVNLFVFLSQLGRPGPFDASKNNVARLWKLAAAGVPESAAVSVPTLVDGSLTRALLSEKLPLAAGANRLTARFQAPASGTATFRFTGVFKASLDGKPLSLVPGDNKFSVASGAHTLGVEFDARTLPELIRVESPDATFLGE